MACYVECGAPVQIKFTSQHQDFNMEQKNVEGQLASDIADQKGRKKKWHVKNL